MRKWCSRLWINALLFFFILSNSANALVSYAAQERAVDTIVLETESASDEEVPVDIKWKTRQEGGKWIETLEVSEGVESLLLILNDEDGAVTKTQAAPDDKPARVKKREMLSNSRLLYYTKSSDGEWKKVLSTACILSGGENLETEELYGVYRLEFAFGQEENPGSLVPYQKLTSKDYWVTDEDSEKYGTIVQPGPKGIQEMQAICLEDMKAYSNYGMVLKPEEEDEPYPALMVNCQQADAVEGTISGIQLPQSYVRMMIQAVDQDTRIAIAKDVNELEYR